MKSQLIKFIRYEDKKLILLPTAKGAEYLNDPTKRKHFDTPNAQGAESMVQLAQTAEEIGKIQLIAYVATFPKEIVHMTVEDNDKLNYFRVRVMTTDSRNYHFRIPRVA